MGIISDLKAMKDVAKIKNGGTAKLSISQITGLIVNLPDAQRNLSQIEFKKVYDLFRKLRTCKTKIQMNIDGYLKQAVEIIKMFDDIAPYQKYSGGNEVEISFLMDDLRGGKSGFGVLNNERFDEARKATEKMFEEDYGLSNSYNEIEDANDDSIEIEEDFEPILYVKSFNGETFSIPESLLPRWVEIDKKYFEEKMLQLLCEAQLTGDFKELDEYINDDTEIEVCTRSRNEGKREIEKGKQIIIDYFIRQRNYKNEHKYNPEYQIVELIGDKDGEVKYNDGDLAVLETVCKCEPRVKTMMLRIKTEGYMISKIELSGEQKFGEYRIKQKEN